jgi:hypothetical protein
VAICADLGWHTVQFERATTLVVRRERYYLMALISDRQQAQQFASEREALFRPLWVEGFDDAERRLTYEAEKDALRRARARSLYTALPQLAECAHEDYLLRVNNS